MTNRRRISVDSARNLVRLAWAPDNRRIAVVGGLDTRLSIIDTRNGQRVFGPEDRPIHAQSFVFSPDGRFLAVHRGGLAEQAPAGGAPPDWPGRYSVSLWHAATMAPLQNLVEPLGELRSYGGDDLVFSPDSRYLAVAYLFELAFYREEEGSWRRAGALGPALQRISLGPDSGTAAGTTSRPAKPGFMEAGVAVCAVPSARIERKWVSFPEVR